MKKLLGIDYGDKRIGVALAEGQIALPFGIIENRNSKFIISELKEIIKQNDIDAIVIGIPYHLKQKQGGKRLEATQEFIINLKENLDILHTMSEALIKYETIDSDQIDQLMARETVTPPKDWDDDDESKPSAASSEEKKEDKGDGSIGGPASLH